MLDLTAGPPPRLAAPGDASGLKDNSRVPGGIEEFLRRRLAEPLPGDESHARFSPRAKGKPPVKRDAPPDARQAAALILLYPQSSNHGGPWRNQVENGSSMNLHVLHGEKLLVPLTVRRADLVQHPGQVSLPGGRIDAGETAEEAALREAQEEIGVDPASVRILGTLSPIIVNVSRYVVTPIVGITDARPDFRLAEYEVAELIEAPLADLCSESHWKWGNRTREGYLIDYPYFDIAGHHVWGATAMMLGEFTELFGRSS
jgi:8-oxo-dGTP pyrophosphatase MutT (NUDIX family)